LGKVKYFHERAQISFKIYCVSLIAMLVVLLGHSLLFFLQYKSLEFDAAASNNDFFNMVVAEWQAGLVTGLSVSLNGCPDPAFARRWHGTYGFRR